MKCVAMDMEADTEVHLTVAAAVAVAVSLDFWAIFLAKFYKKLQNSIYLSIKKKLLDKENTV